MRRLERRRLLTAVAAGLALAAALIGCDGWDPRSPFERNAPEVNEALQKLDAGQTRPAEETLARYLGTGPCSADAGLSLPPSIRQKPSGAFDLGLTLFSLGEQFGQRFGDEEQSDGGSPREQELDQRRALEAGCALLIARAVAEDRSVAPELRARAHYLAGNLEFLLKKYEDAVKEYDQALGLVPGLRAADGGPSVDGIGRDAAWNRAIALRRIEDQKDAGNDAPDSSDQPDSSPPDAGDGGDKGDAGHDGGNDGGKGDAGNDGGNDKGDAGKDAGDKDDAGKDGGSDDQDAGGSPPPPQPSATPSAAPQQDNRILEMLEQQTPSYQEQEAKQRARARRGRPTMEDK